MDTNALPSPSPAARPLAGHVVAITGGNGGIGLGMALGCARAGAHIAIWARNEDKSAAAAERLQSEVPSCEVLTARCDVAEIEQIDAALAATIDRFGRIDAGVANSGTSGQAKFLDLTPQEWRRMMSINLDGVFFTMQAIARKMVEQGEGGALVAVSSTSAVHGAPVTAHYATAKTALLGLTRSAAVALGRKNIRVNALVPGWTITDLARGGYENDRFREVTVGRTPAGRWADPDEFAAVGAYLCDKSLTYHTGDTITVDGGYTVF